MFKFKSIFLKIYYHNIFRKHVNINVNIECNRMDAQMSTFICTCLSNLRTSPGISSSGSDSPVSSSSAYTRRPPPRRTAAGGSCW